MRQDQGKQQQQRPGQKPQGNQNPMNPSREDIQQREEEEEGEAGQRREEEDEEITQRQPPSGGGRTGLNE